MVTFILPYTAQLHRECRIWNLKIDIIRNNTLSIVEISNCIILKYSTQLTS